MVLGRISLRAAKWPREDWEVDTARLVLSVCPLPPPPNHAVFSLPGTGGVGGCTEVGRTRPSMQMREGFQDGQQGKMREVRERPRFLPGRKCHPL